MPEKRTLTLDDIAAETGLELPARHMLLVTIVVTNLLNNLSVEIPVKNNNIAIQVCAAVDVLNTTFGQEVLTCDIQQRQ